MSFSISAPVDVGQDVANAIDAAFAASPAAKEHAGPYADIARDAAVSLATAVRREQDGVHVSISGHRNPGNEPVTGWADCLISISVGQVAPKPTA